MKGHIGFTGTREGMTDEQIKEVVSVLKMLKDLGYHTLHHGDCLGADSTAHDLALELGLSVVVHPPINSRLRAWRDGHEVMKTKSYMTRNADIVKACDFLIATPKQKTAMTWPKRGGTWSTIRMGQNKPVSMAIIWGDGDSNTSHRS